jgi:hypothetical protein
MLAPATLSAADAAAADAHTAAANAADVATAAAAFAAFVAADAAAAAAAADPLPFDIFGNPIPVRTWGASSAPSPEPAAVPEFAPKTALHIGPPTRGGVRECERVAALISAGKKLASPAFRKRVIAANCLNVGYVVVVDISPNQASMAGATTWTKFVAYIDGAHRPVGIDPQISKRFAHIDSSRFALAVIRVGAASEVVVTPLPWARGVPVDHCSHCGSTTRACVSDGVRCVL